VVVGESSGYGGDYSGYGADERWILPGTELTLRLEHRYDESAYGVPYYTERASASVRALRAV
jgi:hypothetical protein